jgi:hypothetical protein
MTDPKNCENTGPIREPEASESLQEWTVRMLLEDKLESAPIALHLMVPPCNSRH